MSEPLGECDLAVVGAGIVGLAVARELLLRYPGRTLQVLEREPEVAMHQTGHNSGVIHQGLYYRPGSLKADLCTRGARQLYAYCELRGIPARRAGKVVIAVRAAELPRLDELEHRGAANGVPGLRRIAPSELRELEPHATGIAALHSPRTGVVDFGRVARALRDDVLAAGGAVATGCDVARVGRSPGRLRLVHARGETRPRLSVFCAGAWSDRVARLCGGADDPRIVPFRGGYMQLRGDRRDLVRSLIYPVPDPALPFLGAHLTRHIDGRVTVGPTALPAGSRDVGRLFRCRPRDLAGTLAWPGSYRMARRWWRTGVTELRHTVSRGALASTAARYIPELSAGDLVPGPAGVRAQAVARNGGLVDDFVFLHTERALHVRNAPSPAATAALAIASHVADELERAFDPTFW